MNTLLGCYFPTTILYIDDNINYLNSITAELDITKTAPKLFCNPIRALDYLEYEYQKPLLKDIYISNPDDHEMDHNITDINIRNIHKIAFNSKRFEEISVIIADYAMPNMNGLDFFNRIKNKNIKKILLTGEADAEIAVEGFNKGLIHKYLRKDLSTLSEEINGSLYDFQLKCFMDALDFSLQKIIPIRTYGSSLFHDDAFINLFKKICKDNNILEYYLLDIINSIFY